MVKSSFFLCRTSDLLVLLLLPSDLVVDWLAATPVVITKAQTPPPNFFCALLCHGCNFCGKKRSI